MSPFAGGIAGKSIMVTVPILESDTFIVFDLETTGLEPEKGHEIIEIGAVRIRDDEIGNRELST